MNTQSARHRPANVVGMQLDLIRHSDAAQAAALRTAAETALIDYHWTEDERIQRHRYYLDQAARLEKQAHE